MDISEELQRLVPFLEMICPDGGEEAIERAEMVLEETGGLPELMLLQQATNNKALWYVEDDRFQLIESIRHIAALWNANALSAADDEEEEAVLYDLEESALLALVARELLGYDLLVWQVEHPDACVGFISRGEDEDLIRKQSALLRLNLTLIETW
ncbi:MAG: hypothetical protein Q4B71_07150 [Cardiobacteriaceae bacterium]|nr:hypothetical protein [Cardiobacteriaceae bacterium]